VSGHVHLQEVGLLLCDVNGACEHEKKLQLMEVSEYNEAWK